MGGISYVELLILHELWAGERLSLEKALPRCLRPGRPIQCRLFHLVQALIFGDPVVFIGALMRSLCLLPGGLGRFVPCSIGANHCRLRHIGWEKCGHGLTSRPRESASSFLDSFVILLGLGVCQLLDMLLVWLLLLVLFRRLLLMVHVRRFTGLVVLDLGGKEFDLTEKPLHTSRVSQFNQGHVCGRGCIMWCIQVFYS